MEDGLTGLYYCRHTNYHCAFLLYCVFFCTKLERSAKQLLAVDPSYCYIYHSKQAVNYFMLFVCLYYYLFFHLECSVKQVLTADLSVHTVSRCEIIYRNEYEKSH